MDKWTWIATGICWATASMGGWLSLLAQVDPTFSNFAAPVTSLTSAGVMGWYAWYVTTKVLPDKDRSHFEVEKAQRIEYSANINTLVANFNLNIEKRSDECRAERAAYFASIDKLGGRVESLATAMNQYGFNQT